jgi:hypothetical protein
MFDGWYDITCLSCYDGVLNTFDTTVSLIFSHFLLANDICKWMKR